jgi:hypothetical protein
MKKIHMRGPQSRVWGLGVSSLALIRIHPRDTGYAAFVSLRVLGASAVNHSNPSAALRSLWLRYFPTMRFIHLTRASRS